MCIFCLFCVLSLALHPGSCWKGWIPTSIQAFCFQFESIKMDRHLPSKKLHSFSKIIPKVNSYVGDDVDGDADFLNKLYLPHFYDLFPPDDYRNSVVVLPSIEEETAASIANRSVIIVVISLTLDRKSVVI